MIYLVSKLEELFKSTEYAKISPEEAIQMLEREPILGADTETMGLCPHTKKILTIQLGTEDFQIVWDCISYDIHMLQPILESTDILFIWWNAKFDLQFLYYQGIIPRNVYDGMLAEKLMWLGYPSGMHSMSLKSAGFEYCGIELDKTVRGKIIDVGLTPEVIVYAADDVKYEIPIYKAQMKLLEEKDLLKAIEFENEFVKVLAYIEYCGVKLDIPRWKVKIEKDRERTIMAEESLDNWILNFYYEHKNGEYTIEWNGQTIPFNYVYQDPQGSLFDGFETTPHCTINWASSKQLIPLFELLGFKLDTFNKVSKKKTKSVESKIIEAQLEVSDIAPLYIEYKKADKVSTTYGENFLNAVNPKTGRIHASFYQLMDTGRLSCGGGEAQVNIQNLPADAETRACFIAEPGNKWISADYQGQESRIIASISNDPAMIELFNNGCGDVHSLVAKMAYSDKIGDTPIEEIKEKFHHERQEAKGIE